jgi:heavy metal efflux system protein
MTDGRRIFPGLGDSKKGLWLAAVSLVSLGLLPAAVSQGIGSQVQRPLATVVVGGMLLGPVMLVIVGPALRKVFLREYVHSRERISEEGADA